MKVLVGRFSSESNEHSRSLMSLDKFILKYGEDCIDSMYCRDIFEKNGIELIPSIGAIGHPHGPVTLQAYEFIVDKFKQSVKEHLHEIDGIFLFLHGASKVIGLQGGSAEHAILREIRAIVGPYMPIALVMDPHGNLSEELVSNVNLLRCYRHSPHIDTKETYQFMAKDFIDLLNHREDIHPIYYRVPIIIGGEKSVSFDEPMVSINNMLEEAEKTGRIRSASFHIGYLRHDGPNLGCSVVVCSKTKKDTEFADMWARKIREFAYSKRHEFHYHGNVASLEDAIKQVVYHDQGTCFITDSGDNVGSGADGFNNYVLRQIMNLDDFNHKKYLVSGIVDFNAHAFLMNKKVGDNVEFDLGMDYDELCQKIHIKGSVVAKGLAEEMYVGKEDIGTVITVKVENMPVYVVVENDAIQYYEPAQYATSGLNLDDYDVVVVKQGYISAEFDEYASYCVMALTDGPTNQASEKLVFRQIHRPMYPYDDRELDEI